VCAGGETAVRAGGGSASAGVGEQTLHKERESAAVQDDRKLCLVGLVIIHIFCTCRIFIHSFLSSVTFTANYDFINTVHSHKYSQDTRILAVTVSLSHSLSKLFYRSL
jgi:hypothetical protein